MGSFPLYSNRMANVTGDIIDPRDALKSDIMDWITCADDIKVFHEIYLEVLSELYVDQVTDAKRVDYYREQLSEAHSM